VVAKKKETLTFASIFEYRETMKTVLLSTLAAVVLLGVFGGCSTTVKTDSGHAVTTGVHAR
jgi:hypothetical protein